MKTDERGDKALLKLRDFLYNHPQPENKKIDTMPLRHFAKGETYTQDLIILSWVFNLLPECFEEWYTDSKGNLKCELTVISDLYSSISIFFELRLEDFLQLFTTRHSLRETSSCKDVADNITEFLKEKWIEPKEARQKKYVSLLKLADYLACQEGPDQKEVATFDLRVRMRGAGYKISVTCLWWIFDYFPNVFPEGPEDWYIDSFDEIIYGPGEDPDKGDTVSCAFTFFSLKGADEFRDLFCANDRLTVASNAKDVAANIYRWVERWSKNG